MLIFGYIAGQSLRIRRLEDLEELCIAKYRKRKLPELNGLEWEKFIQKIKDEEEKYFEGNSSLEKLRKVYKEYNDRFKFWERFPYRYRLKGRRLLQQTENHIKFFEKYGKQGITKFEFFFNFASQLYTNIALPSNKNCFVKNL